MAFNFTRSQWIDLYVSKTELLNGVYSEVTPYEFYRDLFPYGVLQDKRDVSTANGNALVDIITYYENDKRYCRKYVMTNELDALRYIKPLRKTKELSRLCLCSPVSYYGKTKTNDNAHELFAIILDLDYVGLQQLKNIVKQIGNGARFIPPNYLCNSGRGLHAVYLLEEPLPCYKYFLKDLTAFKAKMQDFIWNESTSLQPDKPDHGAITQAFRMVGSETKLGSEYVVRAYKVRDKRWTISELYNWINDRASLMLKNFDMPTLQDPLKVYRDKHPLTMEQAKELYPDWNPDNEKKQWICNTALYYWWVEKIKNEALVGGRYYAILALASYGSKCGISLEQVKVDAMELLPHLEALTDDETNHFTASDIVDALNYYQNGNAMVTYRLTRDRISQLSKIDIPKNKRNYRTREAHLKRLNQMRKFNRDVLEEDEYKNSGRPSKQDIIRQWQELHPDGKKVDCIRDTGLSKPTVYKWWDAD